MTNSPPPQELKAFESALLSLDRLAAFKIITQKSTEIPIAGLLEAYIIPALDSIGTAWEQGQAALSQVYMSGRICEDLVDSFLPPEHPQRKNQPRMAIAVLEDYHLLGKRIVYSALRASGFELLDYGHTDLETILQRAARDRVEILLISVLMLRSALRIRELVSQLKSRGMPVRVVVGGAPFRFDPALWQEVQADAFGTNASQAIEIVKRLAEEKSR